MMKKYLEAGKIINTHGVKGEVKIHSWTDSAEFLMKFKHLYIDEKPFKLVSSRVHKSFLIAQLEGISDVNDAMVLKNKTVFIDRSDVDLPEGSFFLQDIIGASVVDESGTELGKLTDVLEMPASNVYVVTGEREILIPAVPQFIIKTDVDAGVVIVRLIEGM
ncbi:MAG: 16S rRNA processing protein RimM [Clostridiales bacterium]|nr:16S rRNA processing protein RimM [Clostridiales bacterium]